MIFKIRKKSMDHFYPNKYDVPLPMTQQSPKYLFCTRMRGGGKWIKRGEGKVWIKIWKPLEDTSWGLYSVLNKYKQYQMFTCISLKSCTKISFETIACSKLSIHLLFTVEKKCKILKIFAGEIIQMYFSLLLLKWKTVSAN